MITFGVYCVECNVLVKLISLISFHFFNVATGRFKITYVAHIFYRTKPFSVSCKND